MEEIIEKVLALYLKYGIKSVTMDDVARELGISKKTLYQHFSDKDDLVKKVINYHFERHDTEMSIKAQKCKNAIDELLRVSKHLSNFVNTINPSFTFDLQKYYSEIWGNIVQNRRNHIITQLKRNLERGIAEGFYRNDINIDIIVNYYMRRIETSGNFDFQNNKQYTFEEVFNTLFIYHIRGISNKKGLAYLDNIIKNEQL